MIRRGDRIDRALHGSPAPLVDLDRRRPPAEVSELRPAKSHPAVQPWSRLALAVPGLPSHAPQGLTRSHSFIVPGHHMWWSGSVRPVRDDVAAGAGLAAV